MGNWRSYLDDGLFDEFESDPLVRPHLETYGSLKKHEGHRAVPYLFGVIQMLQRANAGLEKKIADDKAYVTSLEEKLSYAARAVPQGVKE